MRSNPRRNAFWARCGDSEGDARPELLSSDLARLLSQIPVHHSPATGADAGPLLAHASRDARYVGDFGAAKAERIAGAHPLRFGTEREA